MVSISLNLPEVRVTELISLSGHTLDRNLEIGAKLLASDYAIRSKEIDKGIYISDEWIMTPLQPENIMDMDLGSQEKFIRKIPYRINLTEDIQQPLKAATGHDLQSAAATALGYALAAYRAIAEGKKIYVVDKKDRRREVELSKGNEQGPSNQLAL